MGPTLASHLDFHQKLSLPVFLPLLSVKVLSASKLGEVAHPKMFLSKTVTAAFFLIAVISEIRAIPNPSIIRERHIIHAPIKFRTIHHYAVKKVPLIITKHLHYYKQKEELHHFPHLSLEENYDNQIHNEEDHHHYNIQQQDKHPKDYTPKYPPYDHGGQEDDYEEPEQSQEEYDEDYEYE